MKFTLYRDELCEKPIDLSTLSFNPIEYIGYYCTPKACSLYLRLNDEWRSYCTHSNINGFILDLSMIGELPELYLRCEYGITMEVSPVAYIYSLHEESDAHYYLVDMMAMLPTKAGKLSNEG